jgi:hypothetical protein
LGATAEDAQDGVLDALVMVCGTRCAVNYVVTTWAVALINNRQHSLLFVCIGNQCICQQPPLSGDDDLSSKLRRR